MPQYFFHVALELFADHSSQTSPKSASGKAELLRALKPFLGESEETGHLVGEPTSQTTSPYLLNQIGRASPGRDRHPRPAIPSALSDSRLDQIEVVCIDMESSSGESSAREGKRSIIDTGIGSTTTGVQTRASFEPTGQDDTGQEWGIVHLFRDVRETRSLYKEPPNGGTNLWEGNNSAQKLRNVKPLPNPRDDDCATLCILAVPSYMSPGDFLAFVGQETRNHVLHFRMIKTARANRYMVLMKFKHGRVAREWHHEWNGRVFNNIEPETCHVVFLKSVEVVERSPSTEASATLPRTATDSLTTKPIAPPTPALVELPTCAVCLERMDESTGLLTNLCQHVFHCTCLEKWSGGGCPVCRYTHDDFSSSSRSGTVKSKVGSHGDEEPPGEPLACETCHTDKSLWQCLICGKVGCGRYESRHAYQHFLETGHSFSLDLVHKDVWDYPSDRYVHRIISQASNLGEKVVELPGRRKEGDLTALEWDEDTEAAKRDNLAVEYTHLLSSQLESQRAYFEQLVERAMEKAETASKAASDAVAQVTALQEKLLKATSDRQEAQNKNASLERDIGRLEKKGVRSEENARSANSKLAEEQAYTRSLTQRVEHCSKLERELADIQRREGESSKANKTLTQENKHLQEELQTQKLLLEGCQDELRDTMAQLSGHAKLQEMIRRGELDEEDLKGATITVGGAPEPSEGQCPVHKYSNLPQMPSFNADIDFICDSLGLCRGKNWDPLVFWSHVRPFLPTAGPDSSTLPPKSAIAEAPENFRIQLQAKIPELIQQGLVQEKKSPTQSVGKNGTDGGDLDTNTSNTTKSKKKRKGKK